MLSDLVIAWHTESEISVMAGLISEKSSQKAPPNPPFFFIFQIFSCRWSSLDQTHLQLHHLLFFLKGIVHPILIFPLIHYSPPLTVSNPRSCHRVSWAGRTQPSGRTRWPHFTRTFNKKEEKQNMFP